MVALISHHLSSEIEGSLARRAGGGTLGRPSPSQTHDSLTLMTETSWYILDLDTTGTRRLH